MEYAPSRSNAVLARVVGVAVGAGVGYAVGYRLGSLHTLSHSHDATVIAREYAFVGGVAALALVTVFIPRDRAARWAGAASLGGGVAFAVLGGALIYGGGYAYRPDDFHGLDHWSQRQDLGWWIALGLLVGFFAPLFGGRYRFRRRCARCALVTAAVLGLSSWRS